MILSWWKVQEVGRDQLEIRRHCEYGIGQVAEGTGIAGGDIDRGGVFAQLAGTMMLLEKEEQQMVKGLIINKFRGDKRIWIRGSRC